MNVLDSTVTRVGAPVWDEQYQVYRVTLEYDCWGHKSETERWYKDETSALSLKVGDTIQT